MRWWVVVVVDELGGVAGFSRFSLIAGIIESMDVSIIMNIV
jgi:hypothetical protein